MSLPHLTFRLLFFKEDNGIVRPLNVRFNHLELVLQALFLERKASYLILLLIRRAAAAHASTRYRLKPMSS